MDIIVVGSNHCWGRGKTLSEAMKNAYRPKHFVAYAAPKGTTVCEIDGSLNYPANSTVEPFVIERKLPKEAKKKGDI